MANLSKPDGTLQARYRWDAWGNLRSRAGSSFNLFGFTGHQRDEETGLYYASARFYDPEIGRFSSEDLIEGLEDQPPSLHRYLYAYANPTTFVDRTGLFGEAVQDTSTGPGEDEGKNLTPDDLYTAAREQGYSPLSAAALVHLTFDVWPTPGQMISTEVYEALNSPGAQVVAQSLLEFSAGVGQGMSGSLTMGGAPNSQPSPFDTRSRRVGQSTGAAITMIGGGDIFTAGAGAAAVACPATVPAVATGPGVAVPAAACVGGVGAAGAGLEVMRRSATYMGQLSKTGTSSGSKSQSREPEGEEAGAEGSEGDASTQQAPPQTVHGHHPYPKALGGHPDQPLADILSGEHLGAGGVHSDLAKFEGGWLFPRKGMTGAQIVQKYGAQRVEDGLRRFYAQPKWQHLQEDFEEAVRFTHEAAQKPGPPNS